MIALGTLIAYSHQAAVVRKAGKDQYVTQGEWFLPAKGNGEVPAYLKVGQALFPESELGRPFIYVNNEGAEISAESLGKFNKAVVAWEQPGSGVVTGLVTKQMGVSEQGYAVRGDYGEEYTEGYFSNYGNVQLYTVRHELRGTKFIYVPLWAATPQFGEARAA